MTDVHYRAKKLTESIKKYADKSMADFKMSLKSESGYSCEHKGKISLKQWEDINFILNHGSVPVKPVKTKSGVKLFDPNKNKPNPSPDDITMSVDVCIIDEDGVNGLAWYCFEESKWKFHTDTLVDYDEPGAETKWLWYYPVVDKSVFTKKSEQ